ncbi:MAG: EAL domain-containing protein [Sphingomonadaceae bacterium]|nr:EAL domain-containing protein [Sphingomonadaceae bacterium]
MRPVDIGLWSIQSKMFEHKPSGEIALVTVEKAESAKGVAADNEDLLRTLRNLDAAGAKRIVVDLPVRRSGSPEVDAQLRAELERLGDRVILTKVVRQDFLESRAIAKSSRYFLDDMRVVSSDYQTDFLDFVWAIEPSYSDGHERIPALWTVLNDSQPAQGTLRVDYTVDVPSIRQLASSELGKSRPADRATFKDKSIVLGAASARAHSVKVPEFGYVPSSMVHIVAAETAKRGAGGTLNWGTGIGAFGILLLLAAMLFRDSPRRRTAYVLWFASLVVAAIVTAKMGVRGEFSAPLAVGGFYAIFRVSANFKRRHLYIEQRSKLPNFIALQRDLGDGAAGKDAAIVIAKISRIDAMFATLSQTDQGRYLRQLASRLALGDQKQTIYYDGGKNFAFVLPSAAFYDLQGHLEGLRAIASQSVNVSGRDLDVSMTIGVDQSFDKTVSSRVNSAISAADQAREAYRPVFIISDFATDSEDWDYSLQARLEDALSEDRIAIKLQPQADLRTGKIVGAEALARWVDEEHGDIAPSRFILQCERAGRLDDLTKRIMQKSLRAGENLLDDNLDPQISINVSAIQFVDHRIADLLEENLAACRINPENLTIEVTETARIEDFAVAREVFDRIGRSGVKFSIDDFGIASANFDALYQLPFSELKIDQMFVQQIFQSHMARSIVANLARLADETGLVSIAEGIENQQTYAILKELGCQVGQGFFIARPMTLAEFREMLFLQSSNGIPRNLVG